MNAVNSRTLSKVKQITLEIVLGAIAAAPILADDTEIFVGLAGNQTSAKSNVLFILDTSGSMHTRVTITEFYDSTKTYTGSCNSTRIYWNEDGDTPRCRFHGVFAPNSRIRPLVTPARRPRTATATRTDAPSHVAMTWAQRRKRVFNIDIQTCDRCGGGEVGLGRDRQRRWVPGSPTGHERDFTLRIWTR